MTKNLRESSEENEAIPQLTEHWIGKNNSKGFKHYNWFFRCTIEQDYPPQSIIGFRALWSVWKWWTRFIKSFREDKSVFQRTCRGEESLDCMNSLKYTTCVDGKSTREQPSCWLTRFSWEKLDFGKLEVPSVVRFFDATDHQGHLSILKSIYL